MKIPLLVPVALALCLPGSRVVAESARPNIVIILADDLGFSDLGSFGSEIPTPHLDKLAANGLRLTQFTNTSRCCPSRASLLTGLFQHQAGVGLMTSLQRDPASVGYQGRLNERSVTLAEVARSAGYHTYMSGKWHLGQDDRAWWPRQRGFDRFYGILAGATSYFRPADKYSLSQDNTVLPPPDDPDYYTTDAFTDYAIRFVREQADDAPFLLYLAYNAPHWPLHAPRADIDRFVGHYRGGWDRAREGRRARQLELGVVEEEWGLSPRDADVRPWEHLSEQEQIELDYRMATYAAQVYRIDVNVGRLVAALQELDRFDNTLILFLSDNGGAPEPRPRAPGERSDLGGGAFADINNPDDVSMVSYGRGWAQVSNTPFAGFKADSTEGGIAAPFIAHWPAGLRTPPGAIIDAPAYLIDVMPTLLELAQTTYPEERDGQPLHPLEGSSLLPLFREGQRVQPEWMYWEHRDQGAVRHGPWKALRQATDTWSLYHLDTDRTERHDLAAKEPERLDELRRRWEEWAHSHLVYPKPSAGRAVTN